MRALFFQFSIFNSGRPRDSPPNPMGHSEEVLAALEELQAR